MPVYTWSTTAASNATADSTINWAEGQAPSSVNDSARAMMAATKKFVNDSTAIANATTGTSTAYTLTTQSVFDTLAHLDKQQLTFTVHTTSGASPTLSVDSLTAKPINGPSGTAIPTGALTGGAAYSVLYDNTNNQFLLLNYRDTIINATVTGTLAVTGVSTFSSSVALNGTMTATTAAINETRTTVASGSTCAIGAAAANYVQVTGTSTINNFDTAQAGTERTLEFAAALTLTNGATSIILPGGINITTAAGDVMGLRSEGSGAGWRCEYYTRAAPPPVGLVRTVQTFTSGTTQTYTPAAGILYAHVRMVAPGGGGGAQTTNSGATGGTSAFGTWTTIGGKGGTTGGSGGAGGIGGTGGADGTGTKLFRIPGAAGSDGGLSSSSLGGAGGCSALGGGAGAQASGSGTNGATNSGGGGSGGGGGTTAAGGGGGGEYVEFLMTSAQLGTGVVYTVSAGATGGTAGAAKGGNGAAGIIVVQEFYS